MIEPIDIWKIDVEDIDSKAERLNAQKPEQIVALLKAGFVIEAVLP